MRSLFHSTRRNSILPRYTFLLLLCTNVYVQCVDTPKNGVSIYNPLNAISNDMHDAVCAVELYCYKNPMSRKLSQSSLIRLLDSFGLTVSTLGTMTITLDFLLKSSSRGGPRVPRPLLPPASRPKFFTRYSTVPSFATFKKSHAPPLFFDPPPFCVCTHVTLPCLSNRRRARQMVPTTIRRHV